MRQLMRYLRPHRMEIVCIVVFIFIQCLLNLYLPTLMANIVDNGVVRGNVPYIWQMGGLMLVVSVFAVAFSVTAGYLSSKTASSFGRTLRREVFSHVEAFSLHEFNQLGTSSLITRTTNDITQVQQLVNMMLRMMIMAPLNCIGGILMAVYTDKTLSWVLVVIVPLLSMTIFLVFRQATTLFRMLQKKIDVLNRVLRENLTGIRVIRSFNRIPYETQRFDMANSDLTGTTIRAQKVMASLQPSLLLIINLSTIAIIWFGGIRINTGAMQVGSLIAFIQYVMQLMFSIMMVTMMFFMIPRASASANRIKEVLNTVLTVQDDKQSASHAGGEPSYAHSVTAGATARAAGTAEPSESGEIEFREVSFRYPGAEKAALSNLSFTIKAGQTTAIIGGTGSGKSTLISLIMRFYDATGGSIFLNGVDVRAQSQANLRSKLGYVPQKAVLFRGTIAENIRYGNEFATDEEVQRAAQIAQASSFIAELSDGMNTPIEQGGRNVSGGQKQRLAIARALVRRPEVYIFDDSFSALDFKTDAMLRAALGQEVTGATVLIVAQRVNTVRDADSIIVLDEGRIAGIGQHHDLLYNCDIYREIVASQLSEEEIA